MLSSPGLCHPLGDKNAWIKKEGLKLLTKRGLDKYLPGRYH
jgi:hypothetical protein